MFKADLLQAANSERPTQGVQEKRLEVRLSKGTRVWDKLPIACEQDALEANTVIIFNLLISHV